MGQAYSCLCEKCGYSFGISLGVGMLFPQKYQRVVKGMINGEYGKEAKNFWNEHPDGAVNIDIVPFRCSLCGSIYSDDDLSLYVPKNRAKNSQHSSSEVWSVENPAVGEDYVAPWDIDDDKFDCLIRYPHKCSDCGAELIRDDSIEELISDEKMPCPKCGEIMTNEKHLLWD